MVVTVDTTDIKCKVRDLLIKSYGFEDETAEVLSHDIVQILENTEE